MARITNSIDLGNGLTQTVENRTARVCITPKIDGTVSIVFERESLTRINGVAVGGPVPCSPVILTNAQARALPSFAAVYAALSGAGDTAEQMAAEAAQQGDGQ